MAVWSAEPWHISGTVGAVVLDFDIDVPDTVTWETPAPARKVLDPCGLPPTMIYRSDGGDAQAQATITFVIPDDADLDNVLGFLTSVWAVKGPWDITDSEGVTRSCVADPTRGSWTRVNKGIFRTVTMSFQQVS